MAIPYYWSDPGKFALATILLECLGDESRVKFQEYLRLMGWTYSEGNGWQNGGYLGYYTEREAIWEEIAAALGI